MSTAGRCPECGAPLIEPGASCSRCLLAAGLDTPDQPALGPGFLDDLPLTAGTTVCYFGDYELLDTTGHQGGMGVVYRARQRTTGRFVALKMLKPECLRSADAVKRFQAEVKAATSLDHPGILPLYEVGEHEGQHYYTMKFVEEGSLAEQMAHGNWPVPKSMDGQRRVAQLIEQVARAVHHAHQRGVLHRDLKPGNILIDGAGQPFVADFGLAKFVDGDSSLTQTDMLLGSPHYMSPEQAAGRSKDVTTASDQFGLGVVMYELLAGRKPFGGEGAVQVLQKIREMEPESPRMINAALDRDLEVICLKCLEKRPGDRLTSARALAEELGRWQAGEPIQSRPVRPWEKAAKWIRRKPALATAIGVALVTALAGLAVGLWQWGNARAARALAESFHLRGMEQDFGAGDSPRAVLGMATFLRSNQKNHAAAQRLVSALTQRNWALPVGPPMTHYSGSVTGPVTVVSFSPDGKRILTASPEMTVRLWETGTGRLLHTLKGYTHEVNIAQFNADGTLAVTASIDGAVRIWRTDTGELLHPPIAHDGPVNSLSLSADGQLLVTAATDATARVWRLTSGKLEQEFSGHTNSVSSVCFAPEGMTVLSASTDGTARLWDALTGQPVLPALRHTAAVKGAKFSPDGRLALMLSGTNVWIWEIKTGRLVNNLISSQRGFTYAEFSPDSQRVLTCVSAVLGTSDRATVMVWDARSGQSLSPPMVHWADVEVAHFSPEGLRIVAGGYDNLVRVWDARSGRLLVEPIVHLWWVMDAHFSPDGRYLVTASEDGTARLWDVTPGAAEPNVIRCGAAAGEAVLDPTGRGAAIVAGQRLEIWKDLNAHSPAFTNERPVDRVCFSPDGRRIATLSRQRGVVDLWDARTGALLTSPVHSTNFNPANTTKVLAFSPDGKKLAIPCGPEGVAIWDDSKPLRWLPQPLAAYAVWSPDGRLVATTAASADHSFEWGTNRVWEASSGRPIASLDGNMGPVAALAFSPDSRRLAAACEDARAYVWDIASSNLVTSCRQREAVTQVEYSADGSRLLTASFDGQARLWDAGSGAEGSNRLTHDARVVTARFSQDSRWVFTASHDKTARLWNAQTGLPVTEPLWHPGALNCADLSRDGSSLLTCARPGVALLWTTPIMPESENTTFLAEVAESLNSVLWGGKAFKEVWLEDTHGRLQRLLAAATPNSFGARWLRWFLADRAHREIAPGSKIRQPERLQRLIEENSVPSLQEAILCSPTNGLALARLALALLPQQDNPRRWGEADFFSRRALLYGSNDPEVQAACRHVKEQLIQHLPP